MKIIAGKQAAPPLVITGYSWRLTMTAGFMQCKACESLD